MADGSHPTCCHWWWVLAPLTCAVAGNACWLPVWSQAWLLVLCEAPSSTVHTCGCGTPGKSIWLVGGEHPPEITVALSQGGWSIGVRGFAAKAAVPWLV